MHVLAIEDDDVSLQLIKHIVQKLGHTCHGTNLGEDGWKQMCSGKYDIIITDYMLPDISGLQLIERARESETQRLNYIIMLTILTDDAHVEEVMKAGADDFIPKPIRPKWIESRILHAVRIRTHETMLQEKNNQLQTLSARLSDLLVANDKMVTLGKLSAGVAHEINNPLAFISGAVSTIEKYWSFIDPELEKKNANDKVRFVQNTFTETIQIAKQGIARISAIVRGLNSYARNDSVSMQLCSIPDCLQNVLSVAHNWVKNGIQLKLQLGESLSSIQADQSKIEQVFLNLICNATEALQDRTNALLTIRASEDNEYVYVVFSDNGPGIAKEALSKVFDPFFTTKQNMKSTGLGLCISRGIMEQHGGFISIENNSLGGVSCTLSFSKNPTKKSNHYESPAYC